MDYRTSSLNHRTCSRLVEEPGAPSVTCTGEGTAAAGSKKLVCSVALLRGNSTGADASEATNKKARSDAPEDAPLPAENTSGRTGTTTEADGVA